MARDNTQCLPRRVLLIGLCWPLIISASIDRNPTNCSILDIVENREKDLGRLVQEVVSLYKKQCPNPTCPQAATECTLKACASTFTNEYCNSTESKLFGKAEIDTFSGVCRHSCSPRRLNMKKSVMRYAIDDERELSREACWTQPLDEVFENTTSISNSPNLRWQYFGTPSGNTRIYPGAPQQDCLGYDPRVRPWYVAATSGQKNVIIVLDKTASMKYKGRLATVKTAVKKLLEALGNFDYIGLVTFSSTAQRETKLLYPGSHDYLEDLTKIVDVIEAGDSGTNFEDAFRETFRLLDDSLQKGSVAPCNTAILFITDGVPTVGETDYKQLEMMIQNLSRNRTVIFTFTLGTRVNYEFSKQIACKTKGFYVHSEDETDDLTEKLLKSFNYFSMLKQPQPNSSSVWVEPYIDAFGLGEITTVSQAIYDISGNQSKLVGVVAIDISVDDLRNSSSHPIDSEVISCLASRAPCQSLRDVKECSLENLRDDLAVGICNSESPCKPKETHCVFSNDSYEVKFCDGIPGRYSSIACCDGSNLTNTSVCSENPQTFDKSILSKQLNNHSFIHHLSKMVLFLAAVFFVVMT